MRLPPVCSVITSASLDHSLLLTCSFLGLFHLFPCFSCSLSLACSFLASLWSTPFLYFSLLPPFLHFSISPFALLNFRPDEPEKMRADDLPATNKMSLRSFGCTKVLSMKNYCYLCTGLAKEEEEKAKSRRSEHEQANRDPHRGNICTNVHGNFRTIVTSCL